MAVLGELLFVKGMRGPTLDDALRHHGRTTLAQTAENLREAEIKETSNEILIAKLVRESAIEPLALNLEAAQPGVKEVDFDYVNAWRERHTVRGLRVTKAIPFSGDPQLWGLCPSSFDLNPPRGTVRGQSVVVGMDVPAEQNQQAVDWISEQVEKIQTYISRQKVQIDEYCALLAGQAGPLLEARRQRIRLAEDVLRKLR